MTYPNGIDEEYSKLMLDLIYELTDLSVSLYLNNKRKTIYSHKYWPTYCIEICKEIDHEVCGDLFSPKEGLHLCKAGLWCLTKPLKIGDQEIGYFSIGHRRIVGKDKESLCQMSKFLDENLLANYNSKNHFIQLFYEVQVFEEDRFYDPAIEKISLIEKDIIRKFDEINEYKVNASRLAHQFLLPIQSIVANAENLYMGLENSHINEENKSLANDILEEVTKLAYIANSIRSQMASGKIKSEMQFDKVDFISIITEAIKLFRREAEKKKVLIKDPIIKNLGFTYIEASKPHLEIIFFNLYHNAVKYSYYSGNDNLRYIDTIINKEKNMICLEISNYGVGIKPEEIDKDLIFTEGYRGKLARDRWRTGLGIGMSVVKSITQGHKGDITVTSKNVGNGLDTDPFKTTIKIRLPITQPRMR